ncbi:MAG: cytochrome c-type biogenesis protein CcmH [Longimicrobiales bacterium]|nr:cytochrome c-type biogenesis protein CcmH [Longimicrobiales bacterium]
MTRLANRIGGVAAAVCTLALLAGSLHAQSQREVPRGDGEPWAVPPAATKAIGMIKSPYCPGQMLEVCPSPGGAALRDSIADLAEQGWKADRIVEWVVARHGEEYRAVPPRTASGFVAWAMPFFGAAMLFFATLWILQRLRGNARPAGAAGPDDAADTDTPISDAEEARLREALRELDAEEEATFF